MSAYNLGRQLEEKVISNPETADLAGKIFTNISIDKADIDITLGYEEIERLKTLADASIGEEIEYISYRQPIVTEVSEASMIAQAARPTQSAAIEYAANQMKKNSLEAKDNICGDFNCAAEGAEMIASKPDMELDSKVAYNQTMDNNIMGPS